MENKEKWNSALVAIESVSRALDSLSTGIGAVLMGIMFVSIILAVFFRYVLLNPLSWTDEVAIYCDIWIGYLGINVAIRADAHPYMEFIIKRLNIKLQYVVKFLIDFLVAAFFVVVTVWGFKYAINSGRVRTSYALGINMQIPMLAIPIGALFAVLQVILRNLKLFLERRLSS